MRSITRHCRGIVLSRENFGEADSYIRFFTREWGLITVLAKSARKSKRRYIGGLDLFCHDELFIKGDPKGNPYLVELSVLNAFLGIRDSLDRLMYAGKLLQWVKKLADNSTPMPAVYSLLGQTLALIEKENQPERLDLLFLIFKLKLLAALGLKPRVDACVRCSGEDEEGILDIESGGLVCQTCSQTKNKSHPLYLPPDEKLFLTHADNFKLTAWPQLNFPWDKTQHLSRLANQFALYHTHVTLPL